MKWGQNSAALLLGPLEAHLWYNSRVVKAVIYDMDGALIDSEPLWRKAEIESFATVGLSLTDEMCKQTTGLRVDEVVEYWFHKFPWEGTSQKQIEELIWENVIQLVNTEGEPKEGVKKSLEYFKKRGYKPALASTSAMILITTVLDKLQIRDYFKAIHSAEFEENGKPHPGVYITTAKNLESQHNFVWLLRIR